MGDEAEVDENFADFFAAFALEFQGFIKIFFGDQLLGHQDFAKAH